MQSVKLGSIIHLKKGKKAIKLSSVAQNGWLPYVDIHTFETKAVANFTDGEKCLPCKNGEILIVCDGSRSGLVGKAIDGYVGSTLAKISAEGVIPEYLFYYLQEKYPKLNTQKKGTGTPHLNQALLKDEIINIPSVDEQFRIVAHIEELFSELDKAVDTLKTTKEQLAVYRQAVLKDAFDNAQAMCERFTPIEELLVTDRKGMSTGPFGTMLKKHEHKTTGVPMLGIENIDSGKFIDGNKIFVTPEKAAELKSFALKSGDIIISRSGTVGELCVVPPRMEGALLSTNLMRVSLDCQKVLPEYFIYLFQSKGIVLDQVKELCKGSTRIFLNQTILKQIQFPIPNVHEQLQIINTIESRLAFCDNIEKTVDTALAQADAMRQSILKQAFEGKI